MAKKEEISQMLNKDSSEYKQSKPKQLVLFEILAPEEKKYSNTIELYDFIPKYYWGKTASLRVDGKFLDSLEREFVCRGKKYKVKIKPASLETKGKEKDYYPAKREELVEDALRKLVCEGKGTFLDDSAGVFFSLYELAKELKDNGHKYSITQLKDALMVCAQTILIVTNEEGTEVMVSTIFPTLHLQTKEDWKGIGEKTQSFVRFNPLVTKGILAMQFRQFDYRNCMKFKSAPTRQLYKRMSHHYLQASIANPYNINLLTVIRDFGLTKYEKISNNIREIEKALDELIAGNIVLSFQRKTIFDSSKKNKIVDAGFSIIPHPNFVSDVMYANSKKRELEMKNNTAE